MIVAEHLTKYYGPVAAVRDVSFRVRQGEVVGLLGLNGAGKTTTLRMLSGLLTPTAGAIIVDGVDLAQAPEIARSRIGFLPETPPLYGEMTVEAYLRFAARINLIGRDVDRAVEEAMTATDIVRLRQAAIQTLSHGQKKRVGIAQAIVARPPVILLDEPTSGLDPRQVVHMRQLIRGLAAERTIMVSSHVLREIHELCDRIIVLHEGTVAAVGSEDELAQASTERVVVRVDALGERQAVEGACAGVDWIESVAVETDSPNDNQLLFRVTLRGDHRPELVERLVHAKIAIRSFAPVPVELESIFIRLTESERATEGSP